MKPKLPIIEKGILQELKHSNKDIRKEEPVDKTKALMEEIFPLLQKEKQGPWIFFCSYSLALFRAKKYNLHIMKDLTKDEFVHILRRQSTEFSRGSSKYRGVTLYICGRWERSITWKEDTDVIVDDTYKPCKRFECLGVEL